MAYDFLPFMILPIYNTLSRLDGSLVEAARDLGADGKRAFFRVVLPLSVPGIVSGVSMGIFAFHDQLCGAGYALQQHL